jgi:hypothetical protein
MFLHDVGGKAHGASMTVRCDDNKEFTRPALTYLS